jgi:hypothetical protein
MTEEEWLACTDPKPMLEFLRGKASDRKLRLFAVGCCKRLRGLYRGKRNRQVLEVAERFSDDLASRKDMEAARGVWLDRFDSTVMGAGRRAFSWATNTSRFSIRLARETAVEAANWTGSGEPEAQANLLRDIFGNPFRSIILDPAWLTPAVIELAQAIYDNRAFDRLPALADALHEAGCDNDEILSHLRGPGPHVRGCWALDLVLGKA